MNISEIFNDHIDVINKLKNQYKEIIKLGEVLCEVLKRGNKILLMGNGGSAADCQHIAAELIARFQKERESIPAIALTTDTSIITAIGNDYSFNDIFSRQISGLAVKGDAVIGISTSGNSGNIIKGIKTAEKKGCLTISMTGKSGGDLKKITEMNLNVQSEITARIQEAHILVGHMICEIIEEAFCEQTP